jgi:hypothetical protein
MMVAMAIWMLAAILSGNGAEHVMPAAGAI